MMLNLRNISFFFFFFWCTNISIPPCMAALPEQKGLDIDPWHTFFFFFWTLWGEICKCERGWRTVMYWQRAKLITHSRFPFLSFVSNDLLRTSSRWITVSLQPRSLRASRKISESNWPFLFFLSVTACSSWAAPGCTGWKVKPARWFIIVNGVSRNERVYQVESYFRYSSEAKVCARLVWTGFLAFEREWASAAVEVRDMLGAEGSAANCSSASLPVLQSGHRLLIGEVATNEPVCHAHIHTQMHTQSWSLITSNERKSAHLLGRNSFGVSLKFKGWLNITTILCRWAFSRWWGLTECKAC